MPSTHRFVPIFIGLILLASAPVIAATATQQEKLLSVGITGGGPEETQWNPTHILSYVPVQRLILELADKPQKRDQIEGVIAGLDFTVDDMVTAGLLREEEGQYWIDFNLLRVSDQQEILAAATVAGEELAAAFLARRPELEALAASHSQTHVSTSEALYAVLGCFSLDWDGLALTQEKGYRAGAQRTIGDASFTPWAKEKGTEVSLRGLFWGSHNQQVTAVTFTSFGDHDALPRFALPDMLWNRRGAFSRYADYPEGQRAGDGLLRPYLRDALDDIGTVMLALGHEDLSVDALRHETGLEERKLERILDLLLAADFVIRVGEAYGSRAVVLDSGDAEWVDGLMSAGREIMIAWHEARFEQLRQRLADLTPSRNGVPFEVVYTEIWHFAFAIANRTLVERGLFADPYDEQRRHQGFIPVVWANGLVPGL